MKDDVQTAVDTKLSILRQYYDVPASAQQEYDSFVNAVIAVGEESDSWMDFENRYATAGLNTRMEGLMSTCTLLPQPKMSVADAAHATTQAYASTASTAEGRRKWAGEAAAGIADAARTEANLEMNESILEKRIAEGTDDDFSRVHNAASAFEGLAGKFFKKKKK